MINVEAYITYNQMVTENTGDIQGEEHSNQETADDSTDSEEAEDIKETNRRLDEITDYILEKMKNTGIKCLWGTANMFSNPRFMNGAGSTNSADVFCFAAAQVKKALELTVKRRQNGSPAPSLPISSP